METRATRKNSQAPNGSQNNLFLQQLKKKSPESKARKLPSLRKLKMEKQILKTRIKKENEQSKLTHTIPNLNDQQVYECVSIFHARALIFNIF